MNDFMKAYLEANERVNHLLVLDDKCGNGRFCVDHYRTNTDNNTIVFFYSSSHPELDKISGDIEYLEAISGTLQSSYTNTIVRELEIEFEEILYTDSAIDNGLRIRVWIDLWDSVTKANTFISYRSKIY
jgi:hypothetical protein